MTARIRARANSAYRASDLRFLVPLAGLEPAACCLGDDCPSSAQTVPVGSRQLRLGRHSVECGLVGCSRAWWNDRENDHVRKRWGRQRTTALRGLLARRLLGPQLEWATGLAHRLLGEACAIAERMAPRGASSVPAGPSAERSAAGRRLSA